MDLSNVGDFNLICRESTVYNMVKVSEALHEKNYRDSGNDKERQQQSRFIMI